MSRAEREMSRDFLSGLMITTLPGGNFHKNSKGHLKLFLIT